MSKPVHARKGDTDQTPQQATPATRCAQSSVPLSALHDEASEDYIQEEVAIHENGIPVPPKRLLGAYYTPKTPAMVLTRWALTQTEGPVLDPSFGGCAFLSAAADILQDRRVRDPGRLIAGVDIEAACLERVRNDERLYEENCVVGDFLQLRPEDVPGAPFGTIVGNPPYIRHHWLKGSTRLAARRIAKEAPVDLPATASAWAYFLLHCFNFLQAGGRLAMLVPEAILQAAYAVPIRENLTQRFRRVSLIRIRDRMFNGTDETAVVVAASGYGTKGTLATESVETVADLENALNGAKKKGQPGQPATVTIANGRTLCTSTLNLVEKLERHEAVRRFSELATVRIGLVTGANYHFIRSRQELENLAVPREAQMAVVARSTWLHGLAFDEDDLNRIVKAGRRALLVRPTPELDDDLGIQRWIEKGVAAGVDERYKCSRRTDWFRVELPQTPDAFATCARLSSPLLVLNAGGYLCSNALHSVYWKNTLKISPHAIALGFLTSLVRVWAELHGRRYGGGVLKLEPSTLKNVPVPLVDTTRSFFEEVDRLFRAGGEEEARRLADEVILIEHMQLEPSAVRQLRQAANRLSFDRQPA